MSLNSKFKVAKVYKLDEKETLSGAKKSKWIEYSDIYIAIYQLSQFVSTDRYRDTKTTHAGLTKCRYLEGGKYRIETPDDKKKYLILNVDNGHRLSQIALEEVDLW